MQNAGAGLQGRSQPFLCGGGALLHPRRGMRVTEPRKARRQLFRQNKNLKKFAIFRYCDILGIRD